MLSAQFFETRNVFGVARSDRRLIILTSGNLRFLCSDPRGDSQKLNMDAVMIHRAHVDFEEVVKQFPVPVAFTVRLKKTNLLYWKHYSLWGNLVFYLLCDLLYKVVQIWPGQTVTCLHTNSPGHIWTTLYFVTRRQRKWNPFLLFHDNTQRFYITLSYLSINNNTKGRRCWFPIAKMVTRTPYNVTSYIQCLSCFLLQPASSRRRRPTGPTRAPTSTLTSRRRPVTLWRTTRVMLRHTLARTHTMHDQTLAGAGSTGGWPCRHVYRVRKNTALVRTRGFPPRSDVVVLWHQPSVIPVQSVTIRHSIYSASLKNESINRTLWHIRFDRWF